MGKSIVVLSDGTGNAAGKLFQTNVWRFYQALELSDSRQIAQYDDGVGSSSVKPIAVIGGMVGWGLKRNVLDLYTFLCRNYKPGDRIYGIGYSRGAFTIRILMQFILLQGLAQNFSSEDDLWSKSRQLYREFRRTKKTKLGLATFGRSIRDLIVAGFDRALGRPKPIEIDKTAVSSICFLGLWDTVDAYGIPIFELKKGIDKYIWPLALEDKKFDPKKIGKACHALSIDDVRTTFHPLLWDESNLQQKSHTDREPLTQVWFAGVHANVGGGYPDDGMSYVSLRWMIAEARKQGLIFNSAALSIIESSCAPYGRMYDSRAGFASYYRYNPRRLDLLEDLQGAKIEHPKVHESVIWRMASGTDAYAPLSLPLDFRVVSDEYRGSVSRSRRTKNIHKFEQYVRTDAKRRIAAAHSARRNRTNLQRRMAELANIKKPEDPTIALIWDTVWWRRVVYFSTVLTTGVLILFPFLPKSDWAAVFQPVDDGILEATAPAVKSVAGIASAFLPNFLDLWIKAFTDNPWKFSLLALLVGIFWLWGVLIDRRVRDRALAAWNLEWRRRRYEWLQYSIRLRFRAAIVLLVVAASLVSLATYSAVEALSAHVSLNADDPNLEWNRWDEIDFFKKARFVIGAIVDDASSTMLLLGLVSIVLIPVICAWLFWLVRIRKKSAIEKQEIAGSALWLASRVRRSQILNLVYRVATAHVVPACFALALVMIVIFGLSRLSFAFMSAGGWLCDIEKEATTLPPDGATITIDAKSGCQDTGYFLLSNETYRFSILAPAAGGGSDCGPRDPRDNLEGWHKRLYKLLAIPLRRELTAAWFAPIAHIGETGAEQYVLATKTDIQARSRGLDAAGVFKDGARLYAYINDAVVGIPWFWDVFYKQNYGTIKIRVKKIDRVSP